MAFLLTVLCAIFIVRSRAEHSSILVVIIVSFLFFCVLTFLLVWKWSKFCGQIELWTNKVSTSETKTGKKDSEWRTSYSCYGRRRVYFYQISFFACWSIMASHLITISVCFTPTVQHFPCISLTLLGGMHSYSLLLTSSFFISTILCSRVHSFVWVAFH